MSWLTDTLIATGALIALVLLLRRPVARLFGPGMAYALWALPLLRLVLPPLVLPARPEPLLIEITPETVDFAGPVPVVEAAAWPYAELAVALWLAGALAFLGWRVWSYRRMRRDLLEAARPVGEVGAIRMVESPAVPAPVAFGIRDKVIALPPGFMAGADRTARDLAIAHELEHHKGRDIAVNFAMQPLLALHWFNPLAWLGWRALRRDQEAACDARVLAGRCAATRAAYAKLIADYAQGTRLPLAASLACPVVGEKSIIHRLRSLTMNEPTPRRRRIGRLLIGAAALALPLTATITYAASEPAPPAPPAAPDAPKVKVEKRIVIIDNPAGSSMTADGAVDDKTLHTRVVEKDGKTIVIKSKQPLSEAEAAAKIAEAEASMATATAGAADGEGKRKMVIVRHHGEDSAAAHAIAIAHPEGGTHREVSVIRMEGGGEWTGKDDHAAHVAMACDGGQVSEARTTSEKDGKKQVVKIKLCSKGDDMAKALTGLRQARDKIAEDSSLSGEVRAEVLKQLDAEIARLSKKG